SLLHEPPKQQVWYILDLQNQTSALFDRLEEMESKHRNLLGRGRGRGTRGRGRGFRSNGPTQAAAGDV
nr:hypothetical protein [Tanacetum cinerariifolium]